MKGGRIQGGGFAREGGVWEGGSASKRGCNLEGMMPQGQCLPCEGTIQEVPMEGAAWQVYAEQGGEGLGGLMVCPVRKLYWENCRSLTSCVDPHCKLGDPHPKFRSQLQVTIQLASLFSHAGIISPGGKPSD